MDGKKIKQEIINELRNKVEKLDNKPNFVVIQVGNDEASNVYIKQKEKMACSIGYGFKHIKLGSDITTEEIINIINGYNSDENVHGIMIQMPLPAHLDLERIQNAILPVKDIDGLCWLNNGKLMHGENGLYSCTPNGVMELLRRYNVNLTGMNAVVVGRSNLVGKPMSLMLINAGATVTVCNSKTKDLEKYTREADLLIVAVGKPKLITSDMIKKGAIVIDVGISRLENGLCGDVDFDNVLEKVRYITPVPGGVGPMTVAMLAKNVYKAYIMNNNM